MDSFHAQGCNNPFHNTLMIYNLQIYSEELNTIDRELNMPQNFKLLYVMISLPYILYAFQF
jgi:hypothetical protein